MQRRNEMREEIRKSSDSFTVHGQLNQIVRRLASDRFESILLYQYAAILANTVHQK